MLFASGGNLAGQRVERAQRQVDGNFVDDVAAQKIRQAGEITAQLVATAEKTGNAFPFFIDKTKQAIAEVGLCFDASCKRGGSFVGAEDKNVMEISAILPHTSEPTPNREAAESDGDGADAPEKDGKRKVDHADVKQRGGK